MKWDEMSPRERDALVWTKVMGGKIPNPPYISVHFPKYSTDISAAWGVVEKMIVDGVLMYLKPTGKSWIVETSLHDPIGAHANTAPEAICIAALRAVGVEIE